jgi:hypothetical protein
MREQELSILFKSPAHKARLFDAMRELGKVYDGKLDAEYASCLYILAADLSTWGKASDYISRDGIDIASMLEDVDFSGGYSVLILLAGNLFNEQQNINPIELLRLDETNFQIALCALNIRRYGLRVADFK